MNYYIQFKDLWKGVAHYTELRNLQLPFENDIFLNFGHKKIYIKNKLLSPIIIDFFVITEFQILFKNSNFNKIIFNKLILKSQ